MLHINHKSLFIQSSDISFVFGKHNVYINENIKFSFKYEELLPLAAAEEYLDKNQFMFIINHCDNIKKNNVIPELASYKNNENLPVFFINEANYYLIISLGEFQPSLYRIYIEGVFVKTPSI